VIEISAFLPAEEFASLVNELRDYLKSSPPSPGSEGVLLPGEPDFRKRQDRLRNGIPIDSKTWEDIRSSAASLGVEWRPGDTQ
jgi:LDH2 family malate/lactate/ureidoglycolate dehydrogenase